MAIDGKSGAPFALRYFEDVLAVEFASIAHRRARRPAGLRREPVAPVPVTGTPPVEASVASVAKAAKGPSRRRSPDPETLFHNAGARFAAQMAGRSEGPVVRADPHRPDEDKQRPMPVPCDATGLALSGGGIRSAAVNLGVLQALDFAGRLGSFDYLSTVSGGGYIGGSLSAGLCKSGRSAAVQSPFGDGVEDSPVVAHLRDFSNYLLPRGRSALRNQTDAAAILLRGVVANCIPVLATLLALALLTRLAFPTFPSLERGSYVTGLLEGLFWRQLPLNEAIGAYPFALTYKLAGLLAIALIVWALARSDLDRARSWGDANSRALWIVGSLVAVVAGSAFLDVQPLAIQALATAIGDPPPSGDQVVDGLEWLLVRVFRFFARFHGLGGASLAGFATGISMLGHTLGAFLAASQSANDWTTLVKRIAAKAALILAALVLPVALWVAYLYLSASLINGSSWFPDSGTASAATVWRREGHFPGSFGLLSSVVAFLALSLCAGALEANSYSLHRFYRDRLSRAFLFWFPAARSSDPQYLDDYKLSELKQSAGPYPIINSALNVQGSASANKRGRNADFFMLTPDFVGSDLTLYAPTHRGGSDSRGMEDEDPALDLATAIAISGAAVSANMGSSTVRLLSPTLALLNVRLGYWLRNPRDLAKSASPANLLGKAWGFLAGKFYLLAEMLNWLDESSACVYLTDGGHIENLGLYELLKRGCGLIVVVDAGADPRMSLPALNILERYARIDFGVRIDLPWDAIASKSLAVDKACASGSIEGSAGPHCAVGRIYYADGAHGTLVYFKASMTGDEKDYILDYKRRYPSFPHETTGDQFFSEEQFEAYRALGFHMVEHFFSRDDDFGLLTEGEGRFANRQEAFQAIDAALPATVRRKRNAADARFPEKN